ncbi:MAG TPA: hypothetical protein VHW44_31305 [Pseudonocardiaceae bacterium]|jgi:hypothetical protein|nr:hypothetical protein [Pseudonocardiaceae bacterium]
MTDNSWQAFPIVPYGATLHAPAGWQALPPVPANGSEILRATGGAGHRLIVFKMATHRTSATEFAAKAQERLAAHGFEGFELTEHPFGGGPGALLEFVNRDAEGAVVRRTREYFAVRGHAVFALGMGSRDWAADRPLIEQIAERFEITEQNS